MHQNDNSTKERNMNFEEKIYHIKNYHYDLVDLIGELLGQKFQNEEDFDLAWTYFRSYQEKGSEEFGSLTLKKISLHVENEKNRRLFLNS